MKNRPIKVSDNKQLKRTAFTYDTIR